MHTSTIVLQGKVVVDDVLFSWWVTDGPAPRLTVSHSKHGTDTRALADTEPRTQARAIAQAMLAGGRQTEATVVLGEDYRREIEGGFTSKDQ